MDRRNLILGSILTALILALLVIGVLILRKRSMGPFRAPTNAEGRSVQVPPGTKTLEEHGFEPPWQEGDPAIFVPEGEAGGLNAEPQYLES